MLNKQKHLKFLFHQDLLASYSQNKFNYSILPLSGSLLGRYYYSWKGVYYQLRYIQNLLTFLKYSNNLYKLDLKELGLKRSFLRKYRGGNIPKLGFYKTGMFSNYTCNQKKSRELYFINQNIRRAVLHLQMSNKSTLLNELIKTKTLLFNVSTDCNFPQHLDYNLMLNPKTTLGTLYLYNLIKKLSHLKGVNSEFYTKQKRLTSLIAYSHKNAN